MARAKVNPGRGLTEQIVTANGREFRTVVAGEGTPLVIFESGLGAPSAMWSEVQRQVAKHTATMSYDRAGHKGSSYVKGPRLLEDFNVDLEAMLDVLGYEGPIVLAGQSWGGPTVRSMAHHTRRPVAGVVLVDGTNSVAFNPPELAKAFAGFCNLMAKVAWLGLHRRFKKRMLLGTTVGLAPDDASNVRKGVLRRATQRACAAEAGGLVLEIERLRALEGKGFPEGATVVFMSATVAEPGNEESRAKFVARQVEDAAQHGAKQMNVDTSRHDIHMQEPTLCAEQIIAIVSATQIANL